MTKITYTEYQRQELELNQYVERCTLKQIRFTNECKIEVLKLAEQWFFYRDIFKSFDFPEYVVNSKVPERSYTRWKNIKKRFGLIWLIWAKKGRPVKEKIDINKMSSEEKIKYLETENAYLKQLHKTAYWHYP